MSKQCAYCNNEAIKIEPFGGKPCCDECFNLIIGGEEDHPPWKCGIE